MYHLRKDATSSSTAGVASEHKQSFGKKHEIKSQTRDKTIRDAYTISDS